MTHDVTRAPRTQITPQPPSHPPPRLGKPAPTNTSPSRFASPTLPRSNSNAGAAAGRFPLGTSICGARASDETGRDPSNASERRSGAIVVAPGAKLDGGRAIPLEVPGRSAGSRRIGRSKSPTGFGRVAGDGRDEGISDGLRLWAGAEDGARSELVAREGLIRAGLCDGNSDGREIRTAEGVPSPKRDVVEPGLAHDEEVLPRDGWVETEGRAWLAELVGKLGREPIELREDARVGVGNDDAGRDEAELDRDVIVEGREVVVLGLADVDDGFLDAVAGCELPVLEAFAFDLVCGANPRDDPALHPKTAATSNNAPAQELFLRNLDMTGLLKNHRIIHHCLSETFSAYAYYTDGQMFKQHLSWNFSRDGSPSVAPGVSVLRARAGQPGGALVP